MQDLTQPKIRFFSDYHEINDANRLFQRLFKNYRCHELGYDYNSKSYVALIWYKGHKPTKKQIKEMIKKYKIELNF